MVPPFPPYQPARLAFEEDGRPSFSPEKPNPGVPGTALVKNPNGQTVQSRTGNRFIRAGSRKPGLEEVSYVTDTLYFPSSLRRLPLVDFSCAKGCSKGTRGKRREKNNDAERPRESRPPREAQEMA
jgi:hypothetical protein